MRIIPIQELIIKEDRIRRVFDQAELLALSESIASKGLLHAPNVETGTNVLATGERRTRAIAMLVEPYQYDGQLIQPGFIPVLELAELAAWQVLEVEIEENTRRANLTWQEEAAGLARLESLRATKAEQLGTPMPTAKSLATEVLGAPATGSQITKAAQSLAVAAQLADPEIAAAKSLKDATKIIAKRQEVKRREVLAEKFQAVVEESGSASPHKLMEGDLREQLPLIADSTFDVIIVDPPYGINADNFGSQSNNGHNYADTPEYAAELFDVIAAESFRTAKNEAHLYVFCDPKYFTSWALTLKLAGWTVWATPLIWNKGNGMLPLPDHGPRRVYEAIIFANKGNRTTKKVGPDVIDVRAVQRVVHGAQKPDELYIELLSRSALPGDTVGDFCAGSGTIFRAATAAMVSAIGVELVDENIVQCKLSIAGQFETEVMGKGAVTPASAAATNLLEAF